MRWQDEVGKYVTEYWRYVGHGSCDYCQDDDANLYTVRDLRKLRVIVPPKLCLACRGKYEAGVLEIATQPDNYH